MDGNFINASTPPPSNSNADHAPLGKNKTDNVKRLPRFICHPNGIVLQVRIQISSLASSSVAVAAVAVAVAAAAAAAAATLMTNMEMEVETNQNGIKQRVKHLPSFGNHPNGIVLRVLKDNDQGFVHHHHQNQPSSVIQMELY